MTVGYLDPGDNTVKQVKTADDVYNVLYDVIKPLLEALTSIGTPAPVYAIGLPYKICPANATTAFSSAPAIGDRLDTLYILPTDTSPAGTVQLKDGPTVIWTWQGGTLATNQPQPFPFGIKASSASGFSIVAPSDVSAFAIGNWAP